jgi:GNAT superfamily N-acetyltransferase
VSDQIRVRPARRQDVGQVHRLIHELAEFEREPDAVQARVEDLDAALFGPHPQVFCHIAEHTGGGTAPAGFALWYVTFSTWTGRHGIWLEDLYVRPEYRGSGVGRSLLGALALLGAERGYTRLEWWVLDWNEQAHRFYRRIGARPQDEWTVWRLDDTGIADLATAPPGRVRMAESGATGRDASRTPRPSKGTPGDDDMA